MWKFQGQGMNLCHSSDNVRSLTCCTPREYLDFKLINQNNFKQYFDCICKIKFDNNYAKILVKSIKQIPNLASINEVEEYLLHIFENNKIWDSDLFTLIYDGYTNKPEIILVS